ncbi:MAG: RNA-guided pseudouridylation complex pseudouridine synthase subunit Cbf5 [Candidatus Altiarchaeota archaeon]|nr:RNA-guided pseudouridylation complex pseudouridine synthase subunit Cbf5 [Candidatus Altiarchaeota archaeon]
MVLVRDLEDHKKWGKSPWERDLKEILDKGIIVLDKPAGPTSHQVTAWVKQILGAKKAGHSGTLDPGVTGVLPIMLNSSTKIVQGLLKSPKEYVGVMYLHGEVKKSKLMKVIKEFEGDIMQVPPAKSAVKRRSRKRTVYYFEVLEIKDRQVLFKTLVEAGTYIRKLCHDMGVALGVGANMKELRRTKAGPFTENTVVTLHELKEGWEIYKEKGDESFLKKLIRPVEEGLYGTPKVYVKSSAVSSITHGASLGVNGVAQCEESVKMGKMTAVFTQNGELVSFGNALRDSKAIVKDWDGDAVSTDRVILEKDVYPKTWKSSSKKSI